MTAKEKWRREYRLVRIARRENLKATKDAMIYGTGYVYVGDDGEAICVRPWEIYKNLERSRT